MHLAPKKGSHEHGLVAMAVVWDESHKVLIPSVMRRKNYQDAMPIEDVLTQVSSKFSNRTGCTHVAAAVSGTPSPSNKQQDYQNSLREHLQTPVMDRRQKIKRDGGAPKDISVFNNWVSVSEQIKNQRSFAAQKAQAERLGGYPKRNTVMG